MSFEQLAMREYAREVGRDHPEREWILTPFDVWERNPSFSGTPGRHPEDDQFEDEMETESAVAYVPADEYGPF